MRTGYLPPILVVALTRRGRPTGNNKTQESERLWRCEEGVYESLGHIPIGRIFLTADERARLDKIRGKSPARVSDARSTGQGAARASNKDAAGFIVSDSGTTRVWKNGDFVATDSAHNVRFPGQVKVESADKDRDDKQETDTSPVGAGDEQD